MRSATQEQAKSAMPAGGTLPALCISIWNAERQKDRTACSMPPAGDADGARLMSQAIAMSLLIRWLEEQRAWPVVNDVGIEWDKVIKQEGERWLIRDS